MNVLFVGLLLLFHTLVQGDEEWQKFSKEERMKWLGKWRTGFPKTSEFDQLFLFRGELGPTTELEKCVCCGVKTFSDFLEQIKKTNETAYLKVKEIYDKQVVSYNEMSKGKAKRLAKEFYTTSFEHALVLHKVNDPNEKVNALQTLQKMHQDNERLRSIAKSLSADDWNELVERFPIIAQKHHHFLPEKARKRLDDAKIGLLFSDE